jgi:hypothetical protein
MALIIPTTHSTYSVNEGVRTYADSTRTEGGQLAKYVLAQFRSDAQLTWVAELRRSLSTDELKWPQFKLNRPKLRELSQLWNRIEAGVGQGTIIVMDPHPVDRDVRELLRKREAEPGYKGMFQEQMASAFVAGTPIAHLPYELDRAIPWSRYDPLASLERFTPQRILQQLAGPSQRAIVRKSMVFAARAHALFDVVLKDSGAASTRDLFRSPLSEVLLLELLGTQRFFDREQPASVDLLNSAAEEIATNLRERMPMIGDTADFSSEPLVREVDSRAVDELQAADIAAGWARELLDLDPTVRGLAERFERVLWNGTIIK